MLLRDNLFRCLNVLIVLYGLLYIRILVSLISKHTDLYHSSNKEYGFVLKNTN